MRAVDKRLPAALCGGFLLLLINSAYIWAFPSPTLIYVANVIGHLALGVLLGICVTVMIARRGMTAPFAAPVACLVVASASALYLVIAGNVRETRWAYWTHISFALTGTALLLVPLFRITRSLPIGWRRFRYAGVAACLAVVVVPAAAAVYRQRVVEPRFRISNPS